MKFDGQTVIVTGGANGIGRACVEGIVQRGGKAIILDYNLDAANAVKAELKAGQVDAYQIDLRDTDAIHGVINDILSKNEQIHAVINVAAINSGEKASVLKKETLLDVFSVDVVAPMTVIQDLLPHMKEHGYGKIVNISSISSKNAGGRVGGPAYAISKAALNSLTKCIAKEIAPTGITCNALCPAATRSEAMENAIKLNPAIADALAAGVPMKRLAEPYEQANMILWFASSLCTFTTGEIAVCDGGSLMWG